MFPLAHDTATLSGAWNRGVGKWTMRTCLEQRQEARGERGLARGVVVRGGTRGGYNKAAVHERGTTGCCDMIKRIAEWDAAEEITSALCLGSSASHMCQGRARKLSTIDVLRSNRCVRHRCRAKL